MCASALELRASVRCSSATRAGSNQRENDGRRKREKNIIGKKEAIVTLFLFHSHVSLEVDEKWERGGGGGFFALFNVDPTQRRNEHSQRALLSNFFTDFPVKVVGIGDLQDLKIAIIDLDYR